ncbi:MAG: FliH/SctL family protein [Gammaproteobacteria bacterium]|jgi:flagellar assembly protein FliH
MSSLIRAPKVNGQPRVLTVEKASSVFETRVKPRDNVAETEARGSSRQKDKEVDAQADQLDITPVDTGSTNGAATLNNDKADDTFVAYSDIPQSYYSTEVATQVSDMTAKLAAANEELEELKATIQEKRDTAQQQGYDEGYQKGLEDADRVIFERLQQLDSLARSITEKAANSASENEDMLVEIAFAAVTKMLGALLPTREGALEAVRQATKHVTRRDKMLIRVSEKDYELLKDSKSQLIQNTDGTDIEIVSDPHVELGGCILETSSGSLDSRLEIQLANLVDTLKSVNDKHRNE